MGGPKPSTLLNILKSVLGLATGTAGKALFPIPQADIALATNIEDLLNLASASFAPATKQQFWINNNQKAITTMAQVSAGVLQLPKGISNVVAFPTMASDQAITAVNNIRASNYKIDIDPNGALIAASNNAPVNPNPFDNLIYVTHYVEVTEG